MGKKQHQSDKLYISSKEWSELYGGHKAKGKTAFERLPFDCCALSFQVHEAQLQCHSGFPPPAPRPCGVSMC